MLREIEAKSGQTPKALEDAPVLSSITQEVVTAFGMLSSKRAIGMAPNPILLSEIEAYVRLFGPPSLPLNLFIQLISEMDSKYLELNAPKSSSKPANGNKSQRRR